MVPERATQMTEVTELVIPDIAAEPLPDGPVRRDMDEPALLGWMPDARPGDKLELLDPLRPNVAVGRCVFVGFTVAGIRLTTPLMAIVDHIVWFGGRILDIKPGLRGMRLAGPLWININAHIMIPVPAPGRWALPCSA